MNDPIQEAAADAAWAALEAGRDLDDQAVQKEVARAAEEAAEQEALGLNDHRAGEDRRQILMNMDEGG